MEAFPRPDLREIEALYTEQMPTVFAMTFVHTANIAACSSLHKKLFLFLASHPKDFAQARMDQQFFLCVLERFCQMFYREKLRKKPGKKRFNPQDFPFPTDQLLPILRLPEKLKSPLVLWARGFSKQRIADILSRPPEKVAQQLESARKTLSLPDDEIREIIGVIKLPAETRRRDWDDITMAISERGFRFVQGLKSFKRRLDDSILWIAVVLVLFFLFSYFGVTYHWF